MVFVSGSARVGVVTGSMLTVNVPVLPVSSGRDSQGVGTNAGHVRHVSDRQKVRRLTSGLQFVESVLHRLWVRDVIGESLVLVPTSSRVLPVPVLSQLPPHRLLMFLQKFVSVDLNKVLVVLLSFVAESVECINIGKGVFRRRLCLAALGFSWSDLHLGFVHGFMVFWLVLDDPGDVRRDLQIQLEVFLQISVVVGFKPIPSLHGFRRRLVLGSLEVYVAYTGPGSELPEAALPELPVPEDDAEQEQREQEHDDDDDEKDAGARGAASALLLECDSEGRVPGTRQLRTPCPCHMQERRGKQLFRLETRAATSRDR